MKHMIPKVVEIARAAGTKVMECYLKGDASFHLKFNGSPSIEVDRVASEVVVEGLKTAFPSLPVLCEEGEIPSWSVRKRFSKYWLVDPLDGTKDFIQRTDEFSINIALIDEGVPVLGVVFAPAKNVLYYGAGKYGAFREAGSDAAERITVSKLPQDDGEWLVTGSRLHHSDEIFAFTQQFPAKRLIQTGSSIKFCMVAEGSAHVYPRLGPTYEWDTAAGHAVVSAAGGAVIEFETGKPLLYNQKESLLNPRFIASSQSYAQLYSSKKKQLLWHQTSVTKKQRGSRLKQKPFVIWFTGLSASGKSTSAAALEEKLFSLGYLTYMLDGDNIRYGLCSDLAFSDRDRSENIRRVGEVAKLMVDAGLIVIAAFISPFERERRMVRTMFEPGEFVEVFMKTPLEECERRDPKSLYKKARTGEVKSFTGVDSPYEMPTNAEIEIDTTRMSVGAVVDDMIAALTVNDLLPKSAR